MTTTSGVVMLTENLFLLPGAVQTGVLRVGDRAILFDCCDTVTPARLAELCIAHVDLILSTQPRRPNMAGSDAFVAHGAALLVEADARDLYEHPDTYWNNWTRRWVGTATRNGQDCWTFQPVNDVPVHPLPVARTVTDGEVVTWEGYRIEVTRLRPIEGAVAYTIEVDGQRYCFSGDCLYGPGQFWELHPFQETYGDCHGFGGNAKTLITSLQAIARTQADLVIPAHGQPFSAVEEAVETTIAAVRAVSKTYHTILAGDNASQTDAPPFVVRIPRSTSHALIAEDGSALLVDLGDDCAVWELVELKRQGVLKTVAAVYVTHFHGDHHWAMNHLLFYFPSCQVIADTHQADILRHPGRYASRCLTSRPIPVHREVRDGETWQWQEFTLTNFHFPSHSYYHGALLAVGHGQRLLFTGDALSPGLNTGEYCVHNRTLVGDDAGGLRCLRILEETNPDLFFCGHGEQPASWTPQQLATKRAGYRQRAALLAELTPWAHPNFALDPDWVTTYPYEQQVAAGTTCRLDVVFTNYGDQPVIAESALLLPDGWQEETPAAPPFTVAGGQTGAASRRIRIPEHTQPGQYVIPVRVNWDGRYLGQYRQAIVWVW